MFYIIFLYTDRVILRQSYIEGVEPPPQWGGWVNFFENKFFKDTYGPDFFSQPNYEIERMSGQKIKVIGLLENFLDDFEKKFGNF